MGKQADHYFKEDPWQIVEEGFDPAYLRVAESAFSLANEYMGVRGYFEEDTAAKGLIGSYFGGIYEQQKQEGSSYKGIVGTTEFMVNSVNWLWTKVTAGEETLNLSQSSFRDFRRKLNMRNGLLSRSLIWQTAQGGAIRITFERILSMDKVEQAVQRITVESLNYQGKLGLMLGLDGSVEHESLHKNFWNLLETRETDWNLEMELETIHTGQRVCSAVRIEGEELKPVGDLHRDQAAGLCYELELEPGKICRAERRVCNLVCRNPRELDTYQESCGQVREILAAVSFSDILKRNEVWWGDVWAKCDIEIQGDKANQQGIRFCIFQMFQTYNGAVKGSNIGAKGLTGEAYNGNAFWDTETYCLPFFLFNDMEGAKNLLYFRYRTLKEAKRRAAELDCQGAFYPIATISGRECCNLWQHASLQLQASTAVAYGIWFYEKMSGDREFLEDMGLEMLIEISRMLATRGDYSGDGSRYGFYGVMGPDEFQMMVNHNCYTNYMGQFTLRYTLESIQILAQENPAKWQELSEKLGYHVKEGDAWSRMAERMYLPGDPQKKLLEQHEGFFHLPHVDVNQIPMEDFPLYYHWSYDRIYRNDMIKQPDVLMLMLLFNSSFTFEELKNNYEYYEPRCIHESSLSPSIHSILASQLGKKEEAYEFFRFATRMDLDNYNRNSGEGIHTTSIAAAWMNIVYGFGGLRSDGPVLQLNPSIPQQWEGYTFRLQIQGALLTVQVSQEEVCLSYEGEKPLSLLLYGEQAEVGGKNKSKRVPMRSLSRECQRQNGDSYEMEHSGRRI